MQQQEGLTPKKEAFQRTAGLSSGHVSLRFIKKLAFVFLEQEAPLLAEPLISRHHLRKGAPLPGASSSAGVDGVGMPVLEVILELEQNLRQAPAASSHTPSARKGEQGSAIETQRVSTSVWDVPPRYERLRQEQRDLRTAQSRVAIEASRAPWGGGVTSLSTPGTTATAVAQSVAAAALRSAATFPRDVDPTELVTLEDPSQLRELHLSMGSAIDISAEELLRQPPHVAAYRLLSLSECPPPIQEQSRIDDAWLFRTIAEVAEEYRRNASSHADVHHEGGGHLPPFSVSSEFYASVIASVIASVKSQLFLCWCQLFGDGGKTLLFSDAVVMTLPPTHDMQRGAPLQTAATAPPPTSSAAAAAAALAAPREPTDSADQEQHPRRHLPIHYLQERLRRQMAASGDDGLTDTQRFLKMVAQRQLLLQLELRDHQLSQSLYPQTYREDRLGLPRPSTTTRMSASPARDRGISLGGLPMEPRSTPHRDNVDVGHAAEIWRVGFRQRGVAPATEHPRHFPPSTSVGRGYSRSGADDVEDPHRIRSDDGYEDPPSSQHGAHRSFLVGDDEDTFCIPKRRVRMGELGRYVDAPGAVSNVVSLGTYWQHLASADTAATANHYASEQATFRHAAGVSPAAPSPFRAMDPEHHRGSSRRDAVHAARQHVKQRYSDALQRHAAPPSSYEAAMVPGAVSAYTPGRPWTHRHKAFVTPAAGGDAVQSNTLLHDDFSEPPRDEWAASSEYQHFPDMPSNAEATPTLLGIMQQGHPYDAATRPQEFYVEGQATGGQQHHELPPRRMLPAAPSAHARLESMFVATVRDIAPIQHATVKLMADTATTGATIERQLAESAAHRERHRGMLVQAKQLEATLASVDARLKALQQ